MYLDDTACAGTILCLLQLQIKIRAAHALVDGNISKLYACEWMFTLLFVVQQCWDDDRVPIFMFSEVLIPFAELLIIVCEVAVTLEYTVYFEE